MTSVLLIYPYFKPAHDRSIFRFPPLGLSYVAAGLKKAGCEVQLLDCTFLDRHEALEQASRSSAGVVGIYCMMTMQEDCLRFARRLRDGRRLLVAGGPLPSCDPPSFLPYFDVVVVGEGERAMAEVVRAWTGGNPLSAVRGILYRSPDGDGSVSTGLRPFHSDLDSITLPARELLPNQDYIRHWRRNFGPATTTIITTRGCPFSCEFCSNAVFGVSYRERSPGNIAEEVEQALSFGYDRIHFADDVFILRQSRVLALCDEIRKRGLRFAWECLARVDSLDSATAAAMKDAGCDRIFFGIESANEGILKLMRKKINIVQARQAVETAHRAGIKTGAFFIVCYPGETDDTAIETIRFANSLPLDYLSFTLPYPLPGTPLFERVKDRMVKEWDGRHSLVSDHRLIFKSDFSELKMKFAILKGEAQFALRKRLGAASFLAARPFETATDIVFRMLR
ncbi:MAG: B12-binding domain-containing radical SAM protein [Chloroflexi bacterium]|nr:B12-binding domain-containing radical SAM protein [Chloroflexota bacterium]